MSLFQQDLTYETVIHAAQILIELDGHRLMELSCGYEAHSHGSYAETPFYKVIWHRSALSVLKLQTPESNIVALKTIKSSLNDLKKRSSMHASFVCRPTN